VERIAVPKTKKQLQAFLGLTGFYRKFVENDAEISAPLSDWTKNVPFNSFKSLKSTKNALPDISEYS
jgi:hypothetical protein